LTVRILPNIISCSKLKGYKEYVHSGSLSNPWLKPQLIVIRIEVF